MNTETTITPPASTKEIIELASLAIAQGDSKSAIHHLTKAAEINPHDTQIYVTLGDLETEAEDFLRAIANYERAIQISSKNEAAHAGLALAQMLVGRAADARAAASRALEINPSNVVALKVMTRVYLDANDLTLARLCCEKVLAANPADPDARVMLAQTVQRPVQATSSLADGLFGDFATRTRTWDKLGQEHLLQQLVVGLEPMGVVIRPKPPQLANYSDGFPLPPPDLTMGYGGRDLEHYMRLGRSSYSNIQSWLKSEQVTLGAGDAVLDWGCASGRVIRNFTPEAARGCEVWGGDVHVPSIEWAKAYLTPTFRFFNCSALPVLPFPEKKFKFIYAFSVLTHIVALRDLWLIEINRILADDGCAVLTVHNEDTWEEFKKRGMPSWMPQEMRGLPALPGECVDVQGSTWDCTYTFFHSDYIKRTWGQYFRVSQIIPRVDTYQTAVVLRKK
jgi:tetratricopeptide (TPR) repeat protein